MKNSSFKSVLVYILLLVGIVSCRDAKKSTGDLSTTELTIFFINDQHGQISGFAKIKDIVDKEKLERATLLVCAGDIFSGNPIVDQYAAKGYPMVDLMNKVGVDVTVIGNHEFDYGQELLSQRQEQAAFEWICANMDVGETGLFQPDPYVTLSVGELKVTFLGLVETNGKPGYVIPSTHPWKLQGITFQPFTDVMDRYATLKTVDSSDLYIALTHLGSGDDRRIAENYPFFDLIIGGHSHELINEEVGEIPIVQAASNMVYLGKMELKVKNAQVVESEVSFIDLANYPYEDPDIKKLIAQYDETPEFKEVVGYSDSDHTRVEVGCFYTTALMEYLDTDMSFQNGSGIRAEIDEGDVTAMEIYKMDPFNNQCVIFTMTVAEVKTFLSETGAGMHLSGVELLQTRDSFEMYKEGKALDDDEIVTIGINDYIPAVYDQYFPLEKADIQRMTTAETIIEYLKTINSTIDYDGCNRYFDYQ